MRQFGFEFLTQRRRDRRGEKGYDVKFEVLSQRRKILVFIHLVKTNPYRKTHVSSQISAVSASPRELWDGVKASTAEFRIKVIFIDNLSYGHVSLLCDSRNWINVVQTLYLMGFADKSSNKFKKMLENYAKLSTGYQQGLVDKFNNVVEGRRARLPPRLCASV